MAFFSNGRNGSSSSSGGSSASDSDSEEKRFYKKTNNSQRQQSSSTSASSSDSEPKQVSTHPPVEKPAASPSLKKKPEVLSSSKKKSDVSKMSTVRNEGTPSDPNPKVPSATKVKKVVAGKKAKDDGAAEEQPEPKKKSASKGKRPVEEDVAASNPTKKKPRKQKQESAATIAVATPSANDSPQKSSKKTVHLWADNDETAIMHGYLVCMKEGLEFPKSIPQLLEKIKDSLIHEASKPQLYDKLRRMKARYESIRNRIVEGNIKEDVFAYKTSHEKELYQLWKKAWGEQPQGEGDEMEVEPAEDAMVDRTEAVGDDMPGAGEEQITTGDHAEENEEEEEVDSDAGTNTVEDPKASNTVKAPVSNHNPVKAPVSSTPKPNDGPEDMLGFETIMEEMRNVVVEATQDVKSMIDNSETEMRALLDSHLRLANGNRGAGGGEGRRIHSHSTACLRSREPNLEEIYSLRDIPREVYSLRDLPAVDEAKVQVMEEKWREVQLLELKTSSQRLALLQEECSMRIEALKATRGNARS